MFSLPIRRVALVCGLALLAACGGSDGNNSGSGSGGGTGGGGSGGGSGGGTGGGGGETPPPEPPLAASIDLSQRSIALGETLQLDAVQLAAFAEPIVYEWNFGDGATAQGTSVTHNYVQAGYYSVGLTAIDADEVSFQAQALVAVVDTTQPLLLLAGGQQRVALPGDVDLDGDVDLSDLKSLRDHYLGWQRLPDSALEHAQVGLNGRVDRSDAEELGRRILSGGTEFQVSTTHAAPGTFLSLASPALDDAAALVEVQFPGADRFEATRPAPGYATFAVPISLADVPNGLGDSLLEVWVDGAVLAAHDFVVLEPVDGISADAVDLLSSFDLPELAAQEIRTSLVELGVLFGWNDSELHAIQGGVELHIESLESQRLAIEQALLELSPELQVDVERAARANGYAEAVAELERMLAETAPPLIGEEVSGDVLLKRCANLHAWIAATRAWQRSLIAGVEANLVPGQTARYFDGSGATMEVQAIFLLRDALRAQQTGFDALQLAALMCGEGQSEVRLRLDDSAVAAGQVEIYAEGRLTGDEQLRVRLQHTGGEHLSAVLRNYATAELLAWRGAPDFAAWTHSQAWSGEVEAAYIDAVIGLGETDLDAAELDLLIASAIWKRLTTAGEEFWWTCELNGMLAEPPVELGTMTFPDVLSGGPAVFTCNPLDLPGYVDFNYLQANTNREEWSATATWACELLPVQLQVSDSSIIKDDAFELRVDGVAVAATDHPLLALDVTVPLERGEHTVTLIGRNSNPGAIPIDYLIAFTGAEVVSGPALQGELRIGESVEWTIAVPTIGS